MAHQRYQKTNWESVPSYSVRDMSACPVSQDGNLRIDQLAETLRQRGVLTPLLRLTLNTFGNVGALVMGVKFYYIVTWEIIKSAHCSEYEPNHESQQSILGEG